MKLLDILDDKNKILREISEEVSFPISKADRKLIKEMQIYLKKSQIEEYIDKYCLRPGMGLAFVQLGYLKRIAVVVLEEPDGSFTNFTLINPRITRRSEELIYAPEGEGCLSVKVDQEGFVMRNARITVETYDEDGNLFEFRAREELAIAIQHEIDHMNGILYYDHINKKNPFYVPSNAREI